MKSGIKVFKERNATARGNILPFSEFVLFPELKGNKIQDEVGEVLVRRAEEMLKEELPLLPLSLYRDFRLTTVRSRFEAIHHRRRRILYNMMLAEAYERKGRFIERIVDIIWAMMEETTWVIPAHNWGSTHDTKSGVPDIFREDQMPVLDLYAATASALLALAEHLFKKEFDEISPVICKRIDHLVYLRAIRPFISATFGWSGKTGQKTNNWLTHITSAVLFATALTASDLELRETVVEFAMEFLDNFSAGYPEDGFCDEGPGYWSGAGGDYFVALELIDDMSGGKIKVFDHPLVKNIGEYISKVNIDGRYYLNFADAAPRIDQDGKLIIRIGEKCGSPELVSFGRMISTDNTVDKEYYFGAAIGNYRNALTPRVTKADKVLAKQRVWYEGNKVAIFRESVNTSEGLFLALKGGTNAESHNHNDVGCLVVYSNGKPVIVDPSHGSYDNGYFGPMRYIRWYTQAGYHSVPIVDGIEQTTGLACASSEEVCDLERGIASMELKNAFPRDAGILSMRRTAALEDKEIVVTDEVKLDHEGDIQFNYLTVGEPKVVSDGKIAIADGRSFEYDPEGLELVIEQVENTKLPYEDLDIKRHWGSLWRICLKAHAMEKTAKITIK